MAESSSSSAEIAKKIRHLLIESPDNARVDAARLDELRKVYAKLIQSGEFEMNGASKQPVSVVMQKWKAFLRSNHKRFVEQLVDRIIVASGQQQQQQRTAVRTLWGVVATSPVHSTNGHYKLISTNLLQKWVRAMSCMTTSLSNDKQLRHMVQAEFLQPYRDVQYYTMISIRTCAVEMYQQQLSKKNDESDDDSDDDDDSTAPPALAMEERAQRLVELLMMIPIPASQRELDANAGALFPPPAGTIPVQDDAAAAADESSDSDNNDEDEPVSDYASSSDEDEDRPTKRTKLTNTTNKKKQRFAFEQVRSHHAVWAKAWLAVLRLDLPDRTLKRVLRFLPLTVLDRAPEPALFADFFMQAYSSAEGASNNHVTAVLALDGLFVLVTQHGLEYPDYYKQLYKLCTPALLHVKYRQGFFRLLAASLARNEMLPAHVVAAFGKRLLRCCLSAPPSSILYVLALVSNLLRQHEEISCLIHRQANKKNDTKNDNDKEQFLFEDQFDADTDDPEQAGALQSSLWELLVLERHYYPAVQTMAKSVGLFQDNQTPLYNLDDFLVHTYQSLQEQERGRKKQQQQHKNSGNSKPKAGVPLTFQEPEGLFAPDDLFSNMLTVRPGRDGD